MSFWLFFFFLLYFVSENLPNNEDTKRKILDLFASENILYLCDGSGRIHQLRSTRENCETLFHGVQHGLDIRNDPRNVGGNERFLKEDASNLRVGRINKRHTLMFNTVAAL